MLDFIDTAAASAQNNGIYAHEVAAMDLDIVRELIRLMNENHLTEIDVESAGERVRLRAEPPAAPQLVYASPAPPPAPAAAAVAQPPAAPEPAEIPNPAVFIKSPIVGTFYHSSAPDKPPFVQAGDAIDENTVVCIVEAMKVMNEIKAELRGIVREALVVNGQAVEFGQPLFAIEPLP